MLPSAAKLITPKAIKTASVVVMCLYVGHLIKANAAKTALIDQYKEAEKNWIVQWDALAAAKKLSEDLVVKQSKRRSELESKASKTAKNIDELCATNSTYCDTPIPDDIIKWVRDHTY